MQTPTARDLRQKVTFQRRAENATGDGAGNFEDDWADLFSCAAKLVPTSARAGGESVIAGRLSGTAVYDLWVRSWSATQGIAPGDRAVDRDGRVFNIRWNDDPEGRGRWRLMQCEQGAST